MVRVQLRFALELAVHLDSWTYDLFGLRERELGNVLLRDEVQVDRLEKGRCLLLLGCLDFGQFLVCESVLFFNFGGGLENGVG